MADETTTPETEQPAGAPVAPTREHSPAGLIVEEEWEDGTPYNPGDADPYAETRLPDGCGPPYPAGLCDPISPGLIDSARHVLVFLLNIFKSPTLIASTPLTWQSRKFELLDWLRPLELLLRRLLLVEALSLLASQALPPRKPRAGAATAKTPAKREQTACDLSRPETWRVSFNVIPPGPRPGGRRYAPSRNLPPHQPDRQFREEATPKRFRRVLHSTLPLARRLEAAIRVVVNPAPFARRLALRFRARANPNAELLLADRRRPGLALLTDALRSARERAAELFSPVWEMFWSSA